MPDAPTVKVDIDAVGSNKLIDVVVDAFAPATETFGLLGDVVRLARVEVAAKITRRAKEIADQAGVKLVAPPLKFLVPFYEKASIEEADDLDAHERWAQLLACAANQNRTISSLFITLMSQMDTSQAVLLKRLVNGNRSDGRLGIDAAKALDVDPFDALTHEFSLETCGELLARVESEGKGSVDVQMATFDRFLSGRGLFIVRARWSGGGDGRYFPEERRIDPRDKLDADVLSSLGLIRVRNFSSSFRNEFLNKVEYDIGEITTLGLRFLMAFDADARSVIEEIVRMRDERRGHRPKRDE